MMMIVDNFAVDDHDDDGDDQMYSRNLHIFLSSERRPVFCE